MNSVNPAVPRANGNGETGSSGASGMPNSQGLNNMFLQLLVAQLQNQSPLNPMDPTQFVGQLAQFSELSEVTQIEQMLQKVLPSTTGQGSDSSGHARSAPHSETHFAPTRPISAATAAAQSACPATVRAASSILNSRIQGVF